MRVTIITPTFDRARLLPDVHASLLLQDVAGLEWLVVDDGSADDTAAVVARLQAGSPVPVRLFRRSANAGKASAVNTAMDAVTDGLVGILDSDDILVPGAIGVLLEAWRDIGPDRWKHFVGVTGRCVDEQGRLVGSPLPSDPLDATWQEARYRHRLSGERWGLQRAEVLRRHPFPSPAVGHVPESAVWRAIGKDHQTRYIDDVVRVYRGSGAGAEGRLSERRPAEAAAVGLHEHVAVLNEDLAWFAHHPSVFIASAAHVTRFGLHTGTARREQARLIEAARARLLWHAMAPVGAALHRRDRARDSDRTDTRR